MALNVCGYFLINEHIVLVVKSYARLLVLACLEFNILRKSVHIPDYLNSLADALSSCNFPKSLSHSIPSLERLSELFDGLIFIEDI